jgi:hypothetical protein
MDYRDFDLHLRRSGRKYIAHVTNSDAGEADEVFSLPFTAQELEILTLKLRPSSGNRSAGLNHENAAKELGSKLYDAVFQGDVAMRLASCIELARQAQTKVRIKLRLSDVPELASLPWEFLYDKGLNRFLALSKETALVRYLDQPRPLAALEIAAPLKVLVMISSPHDYPELNVEAEWQKLQAAFKDLESAGLVKVERLAKASLAALDQQLSRDSYHIFHYIGHGLFDDHTEISSLVLEDDDGDSLQIAGEDIGVHLHNHASLRLVILNACEGARAASHDVYSGIAQGLIRCQIPAVIGMQFEISDKAAIAFSSRFYDAIARSKPVDEALDDARRAIHAAQNGGSEWGTPVLYLRAQNGNLFNIRQAETFAVITPSDVKSEIKSSRTLPRTAPTGTLKATSRFYIRRAAEQRAVELVQDKGLTLTLIKLGQSGGSSLGQHLQETASSLGKRTVELNFTRHFSKEDFADSEKFHARFCRVITSELELEDKVEECWQRYRNLSLGDRCTYYLHDLLEKLDGQPLLLAMDEVDRLASTNFKSDFFAMLRNWHNDRAIEPAFEQLDLVLITSLEQHQLIEDSYQSPFNVGEVVRLEDFTATEMAELATRYDLQLSAEQIARLRSLLGGHPYLTQLAFHHLAKENAPVDTLIVNAKNSDSPFAQHLNGLYVKVRDVPILLDGVKKVAGRGEPDEPTILRLRRAGLIQRQGNKVQFRCRLYEEYLREQFHL